MNFDDQINKAIGFATRNHAGTFRKRTIQGTRLPYIVHPMAVMTRVWKWGCGSPTVMLAAISHDLIEDVPSLDRKALRDIIGEEAYSVVMELSFFGDNKGEYMNSFSDKSIEAVVVKLADRIENVNDFSVADPDYAIRYANKALDFFKVVARRLPEIDAKFSEKNTLEDGFNSFLNHFKITVR